MLTLFFVAISFLNHSQGITFIILNGEIYSCLGPNSLRCTKILSQCHHFLSFLPCLFLSCEDTIMDDYDGIYNCNGLKYSPSEIPDNF
jgi:hypothetical protein